MMLSPSRTLSPAGRLAAAPRAPNRLPLWPPPDDRCQLMTGGLPPLALIDETTTLPSVARSNGFITYSVAENRLCISLSVMRALCATRSEIVAEVRSNLLVDQHVVGDLEAAAEQRDQR